MENIFIFLEIKKTSKKIKKKMRSFLAATAVQEVIVSLVLSVHMYLPHFFQLWPRMLKGNRGVEGGKGGSSILPVYLKYASLFIRVTR